MNHRNFNPNPLLLCLSLFWDASANIGCLGWPSGWTRTYQPMEGSWTNNPQYEKTPIFLHASDTTLCAANYYHVHLIGQDATVWFLKWCRESPAISLDFKGLSLSSPGSMDLDNFEVELETKLQVC